MKLGSYVSRTLRYIKIHCSHANWARILVFQSCIICNQILLKRTYFTKNQGLPKSLLKPWMINFINTKIWVYFSHILCPSKIEHVSQQKATKMGHKFKQSFEFWIMSLCIKTFGRHTVIKSTKSSETLERFLFRCVWL